MELLDILILILIIVLFAMSQMNKEQFSSEDINTCLNNCPGYDPDNILKTNDTPIGFDTESWMNECLRSYTGTPSDAEQGCPHTLGCVQACYPDQ